MAGGAGRLHRVSGLRRTGLGAAHLHTGRAARLPHFLGIRLGVRYDTGRLETGNRAAQQQNHIRHCRSVGNPGIRLVFQRPAHLSRAGGYERASQRPKCRIRTCRRREKFDCGDAVREHELRQGAGVFLRRHDRGNIECLGQCTEPGGNRTSVFSLKGQNKDIREIGKLLGVAYVLEGSVRKAGDQVRITAQLIRTDNGFHLWSETYDRKLENVFDMQAELAGAIAKALELPLGLGGDAALVSERSSDQQAYAMYLQARAAYRARGDGVKKSIELYREALKRDPKFAPAWAGLASSLAVLPWYVSDAAERENTPAFMREAEAAGKQAIALSPDLPQAHTSLAMVYNFQWQWAFSEQHFKQAFALAPNDPEVHYQYSDWLSATGRLEEALKSASKAVELDPLVPIFLNGKANALERLRRNEEALPVRQAAYALAPEVGLFRRNLLRTYFETDRVDEAEKLLNQDRAAALARAKRNGVIGDPQRLPRAIIRLKRNPGLAETIRKELGDEDFNAAQRWVGGSIDERLQGLIKSMDEHTSGVDPVAELRSMRYADYRKDPRYIRLLNKAGFDDEGNIR